MHNILSSSSKAFLMAANKLTAIHETECSLSSQPSENLFLQSSSVKTTISKTHSIKGNIVLIVNGYNLQLKNFNTKKTVKF